ncbi:glutamyl-tRNA reductase [Acetoanaerobium pronyense]|uniref:glutamyl-tRNA reductase n=1 Tax=Acetoanaerobium pronyense TaxID=1482736 RepID=UPI001AE202E3
MNGLEIAVVGISHKEAPIEVREMASFSEAKKIEGISLILDMGIEEVVILSTCNRSEIYIASNNIEDSVTKIMDFYGDYFKKEEIKNYLFHMKGDQAIDYLYRVCSGLDSIVLGEDQILGQIKDALMTSMELEGSKKILNKLFREAITTAKNIKSTYKISENPLSLSYIGVKFLKERMGSLKGKKALIIGTGKMGRLALNHLIEEEVEEIYCCNRKSGKIRDIIEQYPFVKEVYYDEKYKYIDEVDILISSTASSHIVVKKSEIKPRKKELFALDLALPRDIEHDILSDSMITLFDIDSLKKTSEENERLRKELSVKAKKLIDESIVGFNSWKDTIKADPIIKSLNERCDEIQRDTISYIYRKMDLPCREKKIVEKMINSALKRLVREPIIALKETKEENKREEYIRVLDELFDLS